MAKTRAEIQKAYRERKKQKEGEKYLEKERQRRSANYIPSCKLNRVERLKRNVKNLEHLRRFRHRQKVAAEVAQAQGQGEVGESSGDTSGYGTRRSTSGDPLIVRLPTARRLGPQRRTAKALAKAYRSISDLKQKHTSLVKRYGSLKKRFSRFRDKAERPGKQFASTPKSKSEALMAEANLDQKQRDCIRKHLVLSNALLSEVKATKDVAKKRKSLLHQIVSGKVVKRYRCVQRMAKETGFCRHKIAKVGEKTLIWNKYQRRRVLRKYQSTVITFLERDDNSRSQPGKSDAVKSSDGGKRQTRVLTDYIGNLFNKFQAENPSAQLSLTTFKRLRPKHILLTSLISRHCCLCTKHQNMALQMKTLRTHGVDVPQNPETFLNSDHDVESFVDKLPENIKRYQWQRVRVEEKGKLKQVTRIVETEVSSDVFMQDLRSQIEKFREHVEKVKTQYAQIKKLKEILPVHQFVLHMDFAENYSCKTLDEIQSAYWNQTAVTLHPVVVYYRGSNGDIQHQSLVVISDELSHNSTTVLAIIKKIMPILRSMDSDLELIHYWTDSPTSQYRNKSIFYAVSNHKDLFGVNANWNYFEAGHGKGPCDGLGGVTKRMADEAVRSGKVIIQHATDFFNWARSSSMKSVQFVFLTADECRLMAAEMESWKMVPVKGTMKLHAVRSQGGRSIAVGTVSCHCELCMSGELCKNWKIEVIGCLQELEQASDGPPETVESLQVLASGCSTQLNGEVSKMPVDEPSSQNLTSPDDPKDIPDTGASGLMAKDILPGKYFAVIYDDDWYIGKCLETDPNDATVQITFMERRKQLYQWPQRPDTIWCPESDVLCGVQDPIPNGKSKRLFKLHGTDVDLIEREFADR